MKTYTPTPTPTPTPTQKYQPINYEDYMRETTDRTITSNNAQDSRPVPDPTLLTTQQLTREIAALKEVIFTRLEGMDKAIFLFNENITRVPTDTDKQIQHLKELHDSKFEDAEEKTKDGFSKSHESLQLVKNIIETRLTGMDKAIELIQSLSDKFPVRIDEKIKSLEVVHAEKFNSIEVQFTERDVRTESSARDSKVAVDAALQAAKEAVAEQNRSSALAIAKSEASTVKQIDQLGLLIQSGTKTMDDKFDDMKQRLTRLEGTKEGSERTVSTQQASSGQVVGFISLGLSILIAIAGATMFVSNNRVNQAVPQAAPSVIYVPSPNGTLLPTTTPIQPSTIKQ